MKKQSNQHHWCRIVMNTATQDIISSLDVSNLDALEISGKQWRSTAFKTYTAVKYPEFDICNIESHYKESADIVLAEQVFEHIRNPFKGVSNVHAILRVGGYFLITTPFLIRVHSVPMDYWRWTSAGLTAMLEDCGFSVELSKSWGNKDCVVGNLDQWKNYQDGDNLANEEDFPVMCWALARKK